MIIVTKELINQNKNIKHDIVADIGSLEKLKK